MPIVSMKNMLDHAKDNKYAVGQFNINNLEFIPSFLTAGEEENSPVILAVSDRMVEFLGGFKTVACMVRNMYEEFDISVPVALHLDHGKNPCRCYKAIEAGFTSVMIDGSALPIHENIAATKQVVNFSRETGVSVEAEVGSIGGQEDGEGSAIKYADLNHCIEIVERTGVDALAAALGSVHGPYKGEPDLAFDLMEEIADRIEVPLVLHGGTGIPDEQIKQAIRLGHAKVNVNTENIKAWTEAVRKKLNEDSEVYEPRLILAPAIEAVKETARNKIRQLGSKNKA